MKIAITGHTKGIGKSIADLLYDHEIVGLSRTTGYDIADVSKICKAASDCDVFINNAYHSKYQTEILNMMYILWKDQNKIIINIGSTVTDYPRTEIEKDHEQWDYRDDKKSLQSLFRKLAKSNSVCRLGLVTPGSTDTDMVRHHNVPKLEPIEVATAVDLLIKNSYFKEIVLYV
jgi:NAD(P)-dependent dehydrogenase (short-subunit alcohol dehydrogenase family)